jgi:type I restriction enzyme R subunit
MPTPEEFARINIDRQLTACGWTVQSCAEMHLYAGCGVAVREFPLSTGEANYLLFVDRRVVGEVESVVEVGLARASRLRQAVLWSAFEGGGVRW